MENGGFMDRQRPGEKKSVSVPIHSAQIPHKVKQDSTAAIQRAAHNYLTSGFNNTHLKCAQQNCIDTPLILHCSMILEPIQNTGKYGD
jgi:hypothetical protein